MSFSDLEAPVEMIAGGTSDFNFLLGDDTSNLPGRFGCHIMGDRKYSCQQSPIHFPEHEMLVF